MADTKISGLTALTGANTASGDLLTIVDISDTTMAATGTNKKITLTELQSAPVSAGTANGVLYLNGSKVATSGSSLVFDGTNLALGVSTAAAKFDVAYSDNSRFLLGFGANLDNYYTAGASGVHIFRSFTSELMRLTSTGLGIGTSSPTVPLTVGDSTAPTNVTLNTVLISTNTASGSVVAIRRSADNNTGAVFNFLKSRGTAASPTAVTSGDVVLNLIGSAYGGTNYRNLVSIQGNVETYTSDTDISSYLSFLTTPSGSVSRLERMRLDSSGNLIQSAPSTAPTLSTNGTMVFNLTSNTNLRVSVRGSDGVTRTANLTLA